LRCRRGPVTALLARWLLLIFILLITVGIDAGYYAVLAYSLGHHGLPLAPVAVVLEPLWVPAVALFPWSSCCSRTAG